MIGRPNWDRAREVLATLRAACPPQSLEIIVATNWAVAAALRTDSVAAMAWSAEQLECPQAGLRDFDHQRTVTYLLARTLELALDEETRREWVRWVLYANLARDT
jgi:hypothetical protein